MIPFPDKRYDVIYADPPWDYPASRVRIYPTPLPYPSMQLSEIQALPISNISHPDAWLYLWVVDGMLPEGLDTLNAWGFTYKKSFIWNKIYWGLGYYNRGQHEQLLLGMKGHPSLPSEAQPSVINVRRGPHSMKPYQMRTLIERHHPNTSKIELFARETFDGWDAWGNEV